MVDPNRRDGARRCVFCDTPKVSREHAWPDWIGDVMKNRLGYNHWTMRTGDKRRETTAFDSTVKRVCKSCNEGWMSRLEVRVKPILLPMMLAETFDIELSRESQATLATWALKTSLMVDYFLPARTFWPGLYSRLFRDQQPPHDQAIVWTTAYIGANPNLNARIGPADILMSHVYGRDGVLVPQRTNQKAIGAYCVLRVLHAVFHVFVYRGYHAPMGDVAAANILDRIWPPQPTTVFWPRNRTGLNEEGIESLTNGTTPIQALSSGPSRLPVGSLESALPRTGHDRRG